MEYFKASEYSWKSSIEKVEIERESESSVFIKDHNGKERRHAKVNNYEHYFDSFEAAKKWLIDQALADIEKARNSVIKVEETLAKYESLTNS